MRLSRLAATVLALGLLAGGCGATRDDAAGACADNGPFPVPAGVQQLTCLQAIEVASARLGWLHAPVTSMEVRWDMCPPFARCFAIAGRTNAWVIFTFSFGDPSMVHVGQPEGGPAGAGFVAGDPEPLPDWLLDELRATLS